MTELKNLKRNLKTFPVKRPVQKSAKTEENTLKNSEKIENNSQKIVEEHKNEEKQGPENAVEGEQLLGKLLSYLRREKKMSALMVCREIKKIDVADGFAELDAPASQIKLTDRVIDEIKPFFDKFGLSIKIKAQEKASIEIAKLNELLGGRLQIKH